MDTEILSYNNDTIRKIDSIEFGILSSEEILAISAVNKEKDGINIPDLYDNNQPRKNALVDPRLGTFTHEHDCATCGLNNVYCVGHFGHVILAEPVFHVGYLKKFLIKILSCICIRCSKLLIHKSDREIEEMIKNNKGKDRMSEIRNAVKNVAFCSKAHFGCGAPVSKIKLEQKGTGAITLYSEINLTDLPKEDNVASLDGKKKKSKQILTPELVYDILKNISDTDCMIMGFDPRKCRPEMMIHKIFAVPPVQVRPSVKADFTASSTMEDDLTHKLADIIKANLRMIRQKEMDVTNKYGQDHLYLLQYQIASYFDSDLNIPKSEQKGRQLKSLSSRMKGKQGRIRNELMGKRVDFSGRTVITSDPTISINELGVPIKMAMNLTFPEVVTEQNIEELKKAVENGRDKYPGANFVFTAESIVPGQRILPIDLRFKKVNIKVGDIVERHIKNDDIVLLNRQPTLHKQSMMGHRIKVIDDHTLLSLRLSVAITSPYNADFDGDEMNIFICQGIQTQVELEEIADVKRQIISPKDSRTVIGIVQDGLLGAYNLTSPNMRIDWRNAMNIMSYTSLDNLTAFKKSGNYSGHELFSMIVPPNINITRNSGDKQLVIKNGTLQKGYLGKDLLGHGNKNNLIQLIWDAYGVEKTKTFLDNTQALTNNFNLYNGFSVGIGDASISPDLEKQIEELIKTKEKKVEEMITEIENKPELLNVDLAEAKLFAEYNIIRDDVGKLISNNLSIDNNFSIMMYAGANKGNITKIGQISGCVGLQAFEGKMIPKKFNNRTSPYFFKDDDRPASRGLIKKSFVQGITFPEFFFLNMAGREGLIDSAIKTAESGYIQRRLIKILEDAMIHYDGTVRSGTNSIIQFIYGDSGTDTTKQYEYNMKIMELGNDQIAKQHKFTPQELQGLDYSEDENNKYYQKLLTMRNLLRISQIKSRMDYIIMNTKYMLPINLLRLVDNAKNTPNNESFEKLTPRHIILSLEDIIHNNNTHLVTMKLKDRNDSKSVKYIDDRIAKTAFSIALHDVLSPKRCLLEYKFDKKQFDNLINEIIYNFNKNMAEPGENVGILAAQSLGEPSSQLSCEKSTLIRISGCENYSGTIGDFIDKLLDSNKSHVIVLDNNSHILNLNNDYKIIATSTTGFTSWKKITQISRHPANGGLVKVTTRSGRTTVATLSHSFLRKTIDSIVPIKGSELKIGMQIPVAKYIPEIENPIRHIYIDDTKLDLDFELGKLAGSIINNYDILKSMNKQKINNKFILKYFNLNNQYMNGLIFSSNIEFITGIINGFLDEYLTTDKLLCEENVNDLCVLFSYLGVFAIKKK